MIIRYKIYVCLTHHFIIVSIFSFSKGSLTSFHDLTLSLHSPCHRHLQDLIQAHDISFPSYFSKLTLAFPFLYCLPHLLKAILIPFSYNSFVFTPSASCTPHIIRSIHFSDLLNILSSTDLTTQVSEPYIMTDPTHVL